MVKVKETLTMVQNMMVPHIERLKEERMGIFMPLRLLIQIGC